MKSINISVISFLLSVVMVLNNSPLVYGGHFLAPPDSLKLIEKDAARIAFWNTPLTFEKIKAIPDMLHEDPHHASDSNLKKLLTLFLYDEMALSEIDSDVSAVINHILSAIEAFVEADKKRGGISFTEDILALIYTFLLDKSNQDKILFIRYTPRISRAFYQANHGAFTDRIYQLIQKTVEFECPTDYEYETEVIVIGLRSIPFLVQANDAYAREDTLSLVLNHLGEIPQDNMHDYALDVLPVLVDAEKKKRGKIFTDKNKKILVQAILIPNFHVMNGGLSSLESFCDVNPRFADDDVADAIFNRVASMDYSEDTIVNSKRSRLEQLILGTGNPDDTDVLPLLNRMPMLFENNPHLATPERLVTILTLFHSKDSSVRMSAMTAVKSCAQANKLTGTICFTDVNYTNILKIALNNSYMKEHIVEISKYFFAINPTVFDETLLTLMMLEIEEYMLLHSEIGTIQDDRLENFYKVQYDDAPGTINLGTLAAILNSFDISFDDLQRAAYKEKLAIFYDLDLQEHEHNLDDIMDIRMAVLTRYRIEMQINLLPFFFRANDEFKTGASRREIEKKLTFYVPRKFFARAARIAYLHLYADTPASDQEFQTARQQCQESLEQSYQHLDPELLANTQFTFMQIPMHALSRCSQQIIKMFIYYLFQEEFGITPEEIIPIVTHDILPALRELEVFEDDLTAMTCAITETKEHDSNRLAKKMQLSNFFKEISLPHQSESTLTDNTLTMTMFPASYPILYLCLLMHQRLGLISYTSRYPITVQGALEQEAFFILNLGLFSNEPLYLVELESHRAVEDVFNDIEVVQASAYSTFGPSAPESTDAVQTCFNEKSFAWIPSYRIIIKRLGHTLFSRTRDQFTDPMLMNDSLRGDTELKAFLCLAARAFLTAENSRTPLQKDLAKAFEALKTNIRIQLERLRGRIKKKDIEIILGAKNKEYYYTQGSLPNRLNKDNVMPTLQRLYRYLAEDPEHLKGFRYAINQGLEKIKSVYFKYHPMAEDAFNAITFGIEGLKNINHQQDPLIKILFDNSAILLKIEAIKLLGVVGDAKAIDALQTVRKNPQLQLAANDSLRNLGVGIDAKQAHKLDTNDLKKKAAPNDSIGTSE